VACNPQAWSCAAVFFLLQACLGIRIEAASKQIYFDNPHLPKMIRQLEIKNLKVDSGSVDVSIVRQDSTVAVNIPRREGEIEIVVIH
jgi:glycogen debranching enzyme